jgi:hypothetical protein
LSYVKSLDSKNHLWCQFLCVFCSYISTFLSTLLCVSGYAHLAYSELDADLEVGFMICRLEPGRQKQ